VLTCTAISQKSQNVYEDFKLLKTSKGSTGANGAQYYIAEFKYAQQNTIYYNLIVYCLYTCNVRCEHAHHSLLQYHIKVNGLAVPDMLGWSGGVM
jgi:hypothetical protein